MGGSFTIDSVLASSGFSGPGPPDIDSDLSLNNNDMTGKVNLYNLLLQATTTTVIKFLFMFTGY